MRRRLLLGSSLAMVLVFALGIVGQAGYSWCRADPIVSFNGTPVQIYVEIPEEYQSLVNGPIKFNINYPSGVTPEVLYTDDGFNGYGEEIRFQEGQWSDSTHLIGDVDKDAYYSASYFWNGAGAVYPIEFQAKVPVHRGKLRKQFGIHANDIPMRLIIIDAAGVEHLFEGKNDGTRIAVNVNMTNSTP